MSPHPLRSAVGLQEISRQSEDNVGQLFIAAAHAAKISDVSGAKTRNTLAKTNGKRKTRTKKNANSERYSD